MSYGVQLKESQATLKAFVESKVFHKADAHDIIQNVNEVALNKRESFNEKKNFEAWVIGIAKYQIKSYLKKHKNAPDIVPLDLGREGEKYVVNENPALWLADIPFAELVRKERLELRNQIRRRLTKKQKIIFDLTCEGLTSSQIAERLEMRPNTVCILKYRLVQRAKFIMSQLNAINGYDYRNNR